MYDLPCQVWNKLTTVRKTCWRCEKGWLVMDAIYWLPRRKPTCLSNFFSIFWRHVALSSTKCNSCRRSNPTCLQQSFTHVRPLDIYKAEPINQVDSFCNLIPTWSSDKCTKSVTSKHLYIADIASAIDTVNRVLLWLNMDFSLGVGCFAYNTFHVQ